MKNRKSIRLRDYDYSDAGMCFVTVCVKGGECVFGNVEQGEMKLSEWGRVANECWLEIPNHFQNIFLDEFIIMPNHLHGIIWIHNSVGAGFPRPQNDHCPQIPGAETAPLPKQITLGNVVAYFKYQSSIQMNLKSGIPGNRIWQRNYYERMAMKGRPFFCFANIFSIVYYSVVYGSV